MFNTHKKLKMKVYERDDFTCQLQIVPNCKGNMRALWERYLKGQLTRKKAMITVDHHPPLSKGGKWQLGHLFTACAPCNWAKGNSFNEYEELRGTIRNLAAPLAQG